MTQTIFSFNVERNVKSRS